MAPYSPIHPPLRPLAAPTPGTAPASGPLAGGATSGPTAAAAAPEVPLTALDQLWFQVAGTICNLRCKHCFISCSPHNDAFWFLERAQVTRALETSVALGVKEYYFTGGEPFMHRDLVPMLEETLALGPATVLSNGTLLVPRIVDALERAAGRTPYSLELRISLDGVTAEANDAIRGAGAFSRALEGIERLVAAGFLPIVTAMQSWPDAEHEGVLAAFQALLRARGYARPRLKLMPPLYLGEEANRTRRYLPEERVTHEMLHGFDLDNLLCTRARLVTATGVWTCPILLATPSARLGSTLEEAVARPAALTEPACWTCWHAGSICANATSLRRDA